VTSIGQAVFAYCTALTSISVAAGNPDYSSDSFGVLFNKTETTLMDAPAGATTTSYIIPSSVTSIGDYAFGGCSALVTISIPSSVTSIGVTPFVDCTKLTSISVAAGNPKYASDSFGVLFNKTETTLIQAPGAITGSYSIPSSVTSIGQFAFYGLAVTSVSIPSSVTSIGQFAFDYCSVLNSVTMLSSTPPSLPASSMAFDNEASGFKIHVPSSAAVTAYKAATGWSSYASEIVTP